jgi:multiple sugar transport system substrate-binding protein
MTRLTRRQFLGTTAAATLAAPHVWVRSAAAQQKQLSILCWSHFVPSYDKWFDQFGQEWAAKNNVKITIDHIPHLNLAAKIAAEIATQSGHDIVQLAASGTEKFAPALVDVQDLADKLGKKYGGWTPLDPRLLHRFPRPLS